MKLIKLEDLQNLPADYKFSPGRQLTPDEEREVYAAVMAESSLADWNDITEEDLQNGVPLEECIDRLKEIAKQTNERNP